MLVSFVKVLNLILELSSSTISAKCQDKVGSSLYFSILFFQFESFILLVIGPLQPRLLSYSSMPFLKEFKACFW